MADTELGEQSVQQRLDAAGALGRHLVAADRDTVEFKQP